MMRRAGGRSEETTWLHLHEIEKSESGADPLGIPDTPLRS